MLITYFLYSLKLQPKIEFKSPFARLCIIFSLHLIVVLSFFLDPLLVLIEYVPYGDLLGYLRKSRGLNDTYFNNPDRKPETNLSSRQLMIFAWQIANGMAYLSSKKVKSIIIAIQRLKGIFEVENDLTNTMAVKHIN